MEQDEEIGEEALTEVDFNKLWSEIQNFKDHFTTKGFLVGLFLGFLPSGWDTFSDFAFAADDHNRTIELINATNKFVYETVLGNETTYTNVTNERSPFLANRNATIEKEMWTLDQRTIRVVTYF